MLCVTKPTRGQRLHLMFGVATEQNLYLSRFMAPFATATTGMFMSTLKPLYHSLAKEPPWVEHLTVCQRGRWALF